MVLFGLVWFGMILFWSIAIAAILNQITDAVNEKKIWITANFCF